MIVREVLVHNYKSVCSEKKECRLVLDDKITFMLGANESGKTNLLEAMTKFTTGKFEEDDIPYNSSFRSKLEKINDLDMVSVTYVTDERDKHKLEKIHPSLVKTEEIIVTRRYDRKIIFSKPDLDTESGLKEALRNVDAVAQGFTRTFRTYIRNYKKANKDKASPTRSALLRLNSLSNQSKYLEDSPTKSEISKTLRKVRRLKASILDLNSPLDSFENDILKPLDSIENTLKNLAQHLDTTTALKKLWKIVPQFELIPADPKLWLAGEYLVDDILTKAEGEEELISVRRLLQLADLDIGKTRHLRDVLQTVTLEKAARRATEILREVWKQDENIDIKLEWSPIEGNKKLLVMVESDGHRGFPQHRSLGFRWFLEFYLLYAATKHRNTVLLFEEPGIHLHPDAQDYLKRVMRDEVAAECQIVYTTHLPNMYDQAYPEGCRAITKDQGMTVVETRYSPFHQRTTWGVAMQALGISGPFLRMCNRNIVTEGPADWVYLLTFARILSSEEPRIAEIASGLIHVFPCQGAKTVPPTIPFFFQDGVKSVILLDSDQAGNNCLDKLKKELGIPNEFVPKVLMINDIQGIESDLGSGQHELEDLFGIKYFSSLISTWLQQNKVTGKVEKKDIKSKNLIGQQAGKIVADKYKIKLNKADLAWCFCDLVRDGTLTIPDEIKTRFRDLLLKLTECL